MAAADLLDLPAILKESALLDQINLESTLAALDAIVDSAPPEPVIEEPAAPTVPLTDANGLYCRHVDESTAWRMVDAGTAIGLFHAGWTTDHRRNDLPLIGVQLRITRAVLEYSSASLNHEDAQAIAGELGDCGMAKASRAKLTAWPEIGDDRAPRVGCRTRC